MSAPGVQHRESATYTSTPLQTPLPHRPSQNTEQSSLCYTVGPCQLSILYTAVCTWQSQASSSSLPTPYPCNNKFTCSIFNSISLLQTSQTSVYIASVQNQKKKKKVTNKLKKILLCLFQECVIYECRQLHTDRQLRFLRMERQEILRRGKENEEHGRPGCTTQISLQVPATRHIGRQPLCPIFGSTLVFLGHAFTGLFPVRN